MQMEEKCEKIVSMLYSNSFITKTVNFTQYLTPDLEKTGIFYLYAGINIR